MFSVVSLDNRSVIIANNKILAYFSSADNALLPSLINVRFNLFEHEELSYIPKRKGDKTVMLDEIYAMKNSFCVTARPIGVVTEEELHDLSKETGTVVTEGFSEIEILFVEQELKPEVMANLKLDAQYWTDKSITKPSNVDFYTVSITKFTNLLAGELIGTVTAFSGDNGFIFNVIVNDAGDGLAIDSNAKASVPFCNWVLRLVSYKAMELKMGIIDRP